MVFRHYCAVFFNPTENLNREVGKIAEGPLRLMKGKGISICTFTSVVESPILSEYFKSFELNFLLFELDEQTSAFNFNDKDKENELFGFMNDNKNLNEYEELSNKLLDDIISENINYVTGSTNNINRTDPFSIKKKKGFTIDDNTIDDEIKDLTKSEINEKVNNIIDKGLENLTEYDKKMLEKLSSRM